MKKLLFISLIILTFSSCYIDIDKTVKSPKLVTTKYLTELPKDTVPISIVGNTMYVFNENNDVKYISYGEDEHTVPINIITLIVIFIFGCYCGIIMTSN